MSSLNITGVTISLELKRSTYGAGGAPVEERFISLKAEVPTPAEGVTLEEALERSLAMHVTAWESLHAAELAGKATTKAEFLDQRSEFATRARKIVAILKEHPHE